MKQELFFLQSLVRNNIYNLCNKSVFYSRHKINHWLKYNLKLKKVGVSTLTIQQCVDVLVFCKKEMDGLGVNESKYCRTCNTIKSKTVFYDRRQSWDGLSTKCKSCYKECAKKDNSNYINKGSGLNILQIAWK